MRSVCKHLRASYWLSNGKRVELARAFLPVRPDVSGSHQTKAGIRRDQTSKNRNVKNQHVYIVKASLNSAFLNESAYYSNLPKAFCTVLMADCAIICKINGFLARPARIGWNRFLNVLMGCMSYEICIARVPLIKEIFFFVVLWFW